MKSHIWTLNTVSPVQKASLWKPILILCPYVPVTRVILHATPWLMSTLGSTSCHTSNGIINHVMSTLGLYLEFALSSTAIFSLQGFHLLPEFLHLFILPSLSHPRTLQKRSDYVRSPLIWTVFLRSSCHVQKFFLISFYFMCMNGFLCFTVFSCVISSHF